MNANVIHNSLVQKLATQRKNWIEIAEALYNLKIDENFKDAVGEGVDTWNSYINQPEIGLSRREANKLVLVYNKFVIEMGKSPDELGTMPLKTLWKLLKASEGLDEDTLEELYQSAPTLSHKDFTELIHDKTVDDSGARTYTYMVMRKSNETGSLSKVHDIESEAIKQAFNINE